MINVSKKCEDKPKISSKAAALRLRMIVPAAIQLLTSKSEKSDKVATCGFDHLSPPSSTSSSNLIHLHVRKIIWFNLFHHYFKNWIKGMSIFDSFKNYREIQTWSSIFQYENHYKLALQFKCDLSEALTQFSVKKQLKYWIFTNFSLMIGDLVAKEPIIFPLTTTKITS